MAPRPLWLYVIVDSYSRSVGKPQVNSTTRAHSDYSTELQFRNAILMVSHGGMLETKHGSLGASTEQLQWIAYGFPSNQAGVAVFKLLAAASALIPAPGCFTCDLLGQYVEIQTVETFLSVYLRAVCASIPQWTTMEVCT